MKKIKVALVYIMIMTGVFIVFRGIIFGWDTEVIDMMPGPIVSIENRKAS